MSRDHMLTAAAIASLCALSPQRTMEIRLGPDFGDMGGWPTDPIRGPATVTLGGRTTPPSKRKALAEEKARRRRERQST